MFDPGERLNYGINTSSTASPSALFLSAVQCLTQLLLSHNSAFSTIILNAAFDSTLFILPDIKSGTIKQRRGFCFYSFIAGFKLELLPSLNRTLMDVVPAEGPLIVR